MKREWIIALERARQKDVSGLEFIYNETFDMVSFHAGILMRTREEREMLTESVYTALFKEIGALRSQVVLTDWVTSVIFEVAVSIYKKNNVSQEVESRIPEYEFHGEQPCNAKEAQECARILKMGIRNLEPYERLTALAHYYDGISVAEIAEVMECTEEETEKRLDRIRKKLQYCLREEGYRTYELSAVSIYLGYLLRKEELQKQDSKWQETWRERLCQVLKDRLGWKEFPHEAPQRTREEEPEKTVSKPLAARQAVTAAVSFLLGLALGAGILFF